MLPFVRDEKGAKLLKEVFPILHPSLAGEVVLWQ
jgi:hypothetical protein